MTKKIALLTFHKSINYGSVLQCWALENLLEGKGFDVSVIDYEPKVYRQQYGSFLKGKTKHNLNVFPVLPFVKKQQKLFSNFRIDHLNLTNQKFYFNSNFSSLNSYDAVVCGSDQIWNIVAADCDPIYFLPFNIAGRKIAYAVSTNSSTYHETRANDELRQDILDFDYISEREESGAKKIEGFIQYKKKVDVCIDPTLLHDKNDYEVITASRIIKKPYIFLYNVWSGKDGFEAAKKLSKRLDLPVYTGFMARTFKAVYKVERQGIHVEMVHTSPSDFLSLIKYADWIVTDSFHGTAFSLIFEKKFISVNELNSNGTPRNDERISNILNTLGLNDRFLTVNDVDTFDLNKPIDYKKITEKRMELANESIGKLCDAIEGKLNS